MRQRRRSQTEVEAIIAELAQELKLAKAFGGLLSRTDGRSLTSQLPDDSKMLLEMARAGDIDAEAKMRGRAQIASQLALAHTEDSSVSISKPVLEYIYARITNQIQPIVRRGPGRDRRANLDRDRKLVYFIKWVIKRGYSAVRDRATADKGGHPSACSIVAAALERIGIHMSERTVEAVWEKREPERTYPRQHWMRDDDEAERAALGIPQYISLSPAARAHIRKRLKSAEKQYRLTPKK